MSEPILSERIQAVRNDLTENHNFGSLLSERYLIANGDLIGQWFCFENADIKWRFDSESAEIWRNGTLDGDFSLNANDRDTVPMRSGTDGNSNQSLPKAA